MTIRSALCGLAALLALAAAACGSDDAAPADVAGVAAPEPAAAAPDERPKAGDAPEPPSKRKRRDRGERPEPDAGVEIGHPDGTWPIVWVRKGQRVAIRTEPGGELVTRVDKRTEFRSPTVFGVVRERDGWVGVTTASLPNNRLGWIKLDPKRLSGGWTRTSIIVDLSERRTELRVAGRTRRAFPVTIGAAGSETPTGRFAVTDTFRGDLSPAYGCCAVAISATQPNLPSGWLGGRRIAIHGTSGPLGVAASHGCVRAADPEVSKLVHRVPLGAPVFIRN